VVNGTGKSPASRWSVASTKWFSKKLGPDGKKQQHKPMSARVSDLADLFNQSQAARPDHACGSEEADRRHTFFGTDKRCRL
jgi:hypothetical protein